MSSVSKVAKDTRVAVLDSAIACFARKGYAGASIQEILAATGLSKPTLYYHFESKAGLFRSILDYAYDESFRLLTKAVRPADLCAVQLTEVAASLFEFARGHEDLNRLVYATMFAAPEEIPPTSIDPAKRQRLFEFVLRIVQQGQRNRELGATYAAEEVTHAVFGVISYAIRSHLLTPAQPLNRRHAKRVIALVLDGARVGTRSAS